MTSRSVVGLGDVRRALWHLRHGGRRQLLTFLRRRNVSSRGAGRHGRTTPQGLTFDPWTVAARPPNRPDLRVGVILDDFSRLALSFEWEQVLLRPSTWRRTLAEEPVDLLFVESAWHGNHGAWRGHLTGAATPTPALVELVTHCRERGIPTVFWNKEDPAHFEDFLDTAALFEHVCTTDGDRLASYVERLGHERVRLLTFGAQPAIHNPVRRHGRGPERDVAFAGMYFTDRYPERREQMDLLMGGALDASARMELGLEIFSRFRDGAPRYQFPEPFASRVVGSLDYERMLTAYREYKVFLNVNSIVDSPTMCARRVVEITACGTPVVTTPSRAISKQFPADEVFVVQDRAQAENTVRALVRSRELRDRATHRGQRRIWRDHTCTARVQEVLHAVGLAESPRVARPSVTAIVSTHRPHRLDHVLRSVGDQEGVPAQLVLLTHGFEVDHDDLRVRAKEAGVDDLVLLAAASDLSLGRCLNLLVEAADGEVVAKMDDDDLYGPQYLSDQLYAMAYSAAEIVGKQAHYVHLDEMDATLLRFADREHRFTDRVMGPTIVARRDLVTTLPFHDVRSGEDTAFLHDAVAAGARIYSADRFNFVLRRFGSAGHTWPVSDAELLATGHVEFYGRADSHVLV